MRTCQTPAKVLAKARSGAWHSVHAQKWQSDRAGEETGAEGELFQMGKIKIVFGLRGGGEPEAGGRLKQRESQSRRGHGVTERGQVWPRHCRGRKGAAGGEGRNVLCAKVSLEENSELPCRAKTGGGRTRKPALSSDIRSG